MCQSLADAFCQYQSIRFITVRNRKLVAIYYFVILLVLCYVVGYTIIAAKGYQTTDEVAGSTSVKIKGSGSIGNNSATLKPLDAMDLVVPANELDAFFITTAITTTRNQTQSLCNGDQDVPECTVQDPSNCTEEYFSASSQGIFTGDCGSNGRCQLFTWCPVEDDSVYDIVDNVGNFTVFVKIDVSFDKFGVQRTNIYDINGDGSPSYGYNLFTINEMLSASTDGEISDYSQIAADGAILLVSSVWNCNLDRNQNLCNPYFTFERVDGLADTISSGFNFRRVSYDVNKEYRLLEKLHGVRVMFITEGVGRKFDFAALTVTLGAGLAYLSVAKLISDFVLDHFMGEHSQRANEFKYHEIDGQDEEARDTLLNVQSGDAADAPYQGFTQ
mmetsp:Transcript_68683/g.109095  ORF Transcript_68683/g.109095 Transcript_68683/m.109095 type:complete len:387 (-) Transcript_68683:154-1314(-)